MKNYERPMLRAIELQVNEHIAALVPKTLYKKKSSSSITTEFNINSGLTALENYGTSNQTA